MNYSEIQLVPESVAVPRLLSRRASYLISKRLVDVVVSSIVLLLTLPLMLAVCVLIKLTSKGAALYWQDRVGLNGRVIRFPKMRSMVQNAEKLRSEIEAANNHQDSHTFKMKKDPRITFVGRVIRKLSIDELPQLWLVLKGDMTLVGPRPALVSEVENYSRMERQRLLVKPGLTCIWQVSGRGDVSFRGQLKMDVDYINSRSLWVDFKLLLLTVPAVLAGKGAY